MSHRCLIKDMLQLIDVCWTPDRIPLALHASGEVAFFCYEFVTWLMLASAAMPDTEMPRLKTDDIETTKSR
jgi:hypothetical protein